MAYNTINAIIVMAVLGFIFALILAWASKKFKVEPKHDLPKVDPKKLKEIVQLLPKLNCKRCGYNTCSLYAMDILAGKAECNQCVGIDQAAIKKIEEIVKG